MQAIFCINRGPVPLRYMMVVVPDIASMTSPLTIEDNQRASDMQLALEILASGNKQKTIVVATRTQAIQFLRLLR